MIIMTAEGDARRARLGPTAVKAAHEAAESAPLLSDEKINQLIVLIRSRRKPIGPSADVA